MGSRDVSFQIGQPSCRLRMRVRSQRSRCNGRQIWVPSFSLLNVALLFFSPHSIWRGPKCTWRCLRAPFSIRRVMVRALPVPGASNSKDFWCHCSSWRCETSSMQLVAAGCVLLYTLHQCRYRPSYNLARYSPF